MIAQYGTAFEIVERNPFLNRDTRIIGFDCNSTLGEKGERVGKRVRAYPVPRWPSTLQHREQKCEQMGTRGELGHNDVWSRLTTWRSAANAPDECQID